MEEPLNLGRLPEVWDAIDRQRGVIERADAAHRSTDMMLTARRIDEGQPAGHRVYIGASNALSAGWDNLRALRVLLGEGAGPHAPWTLTRAIFESGFLACWLLESDDGHERRCRGLRREVNDHREWHAFAQSMSYESRESAEQISLRHAEVAGTYRREAEALGITFAAAGARINYVHELERLRSKPTGLRGKDLVTVWRVLSGMQHGYSYALLASGDASAQQAVPGGQQMRVTIGDRQFEGIGLNACALLHSAAKLYLRRSTSLA